MSTPTPGSAEWLRLVSASKVAAILGVSPWESQRSIWHQMRGDAVIEQAGEQLKRGQYLENGLLDWFYDANPHITETGRQKTFHIEDWGIATTDSTATQNGELVLVEAKTTTQDDEWGEPGTDQIPTHYLTQVYWQMALSGAVACHVTKLGSFLRREDYLVTADAEIQADLIRRCKEFYDSLSAETPPALDDSLATVKILKALNPDIEKKLEADVGIELGAAWLQAKADVDEAQSRERLHQSAIRELAGKAQYIYAGGTRIGRRQNSAYGVNLVAILKAHELGETND